MNVICQLLGLRQIEGSFFPSFSRYLMLLLCITLVSPVAAQELDPNLPPGGNFNLSCWKLTRPNQQEKGESLLSNGYFVTGEFYTDSVTGAMVFWCPNDGKTGGSTYPRNELREMMRCGDNSIGTQGINKNNWVFSSSTLANQQAAAAVDGIMTATVAVDHVSETSDASFKVGRTIVGQIHASDDEPCRLYYRKLPGNTKGSVYFAHEPTTGAEQWYEMIGSRSDNAPDPVDGIALGEKFSYEIKAIGNLLTVTIMRDSMDDVVQVVDMKDSGFADDWMYFKAGNYNQNNAGDPGEYAQVSFFALDIKHFEPAPPSSYPAPSDIPRFQDFLAACKLQAPTSSTLASKATLNNGYTHPTFFKVVDGDKILFNQSGSSQRTELRNETNWNLNDQNRSMHARLDIVKQTCDQVTVLQIHDDANAGNGPNKPLLRIYKHNAKGPLNHIWAAIKTDDGGANTTHIDLGEDPGGYFTCDIRLLDGNMIIDFEGEEKVNMDVSFWTFPSYWKAGAYLQDNGDATIYFDELFEADGSLQNYSPSVSITDPANGAIILPGNDITINVDAEDSDGTITMVEFFESGNNKIGQDTTAPYSFTWPNVAEGAYTLTARAIDNEGVSRTSVSNNISVLVPVDVTGVKLEKVTGPIAIGATVQFEAVISPANATNQKLVFETDEESIATVSETGLLTALSEGVVTLTATTDEGSFVDTKTIEVLSRSSEFNWALGQPATGTGTPDGENVEGNLVDNNIRTRWSVNEYPQSVTVDLQGDIKISQTEVISYENRAYQFLIEGALKEEGPYTTLVDRSDNTISSTSSAPIINSVDDIEARYVRITVTGANDYTGTWVSLNEMRIFGAGERTYEEEEGNTELLLGPNPATSNVTIKAGEEYKSVSIFDRTGKKLIQAELKQELVLDISTLPTGIYLVKIEGDVEPEIIKLIKF
ncbi:MAG: polysaccharide lyase family 7 protein [Bacteroidia bacterium]|nr:polysaccharide lyase family 7 protein [Bacteroidia bacterium]